MQRGFSLVELSIVLVILGLLAGGILAGQSLIRAAEIRSAISDYQRYSSSVFSFRDKYRSIPGDMLNATSFWGKDNTYCSGHIGAASTPGTCNGDGNGVLSGASAINATGETFQFWKQLALAGLIEGGYSGIAGPDTAWVGNDAIVGTNVPKARISNAGWGAFYVNSPGDSWTYLNRYGNIFAFGMQAVGNYPISAVFKPEEAWNFDIKLDDGKPASGRIWAFEASAGFGTASACTTSSSSTDYSGSYKLTTSTLACSMWFKEAF